MAKFVFKLHSLLNLKLQLEESKKNELGKAVVKLENEKLALKELFNHQDNNINEFNQKAQNGVRVDELKEYTLFLSTLKQKISNQKEKVNYEQINVDKVREELIIAVQEREMLEKLKEKKFEEYKLEEQKLDQKLMDELVSYREALK